MVRVYSHPDPGIAHLVRNALSQRGIDAVLRGERYGAALGEVPPIAAWSEVWVGDPARLDEAVAVVAETVAPAPSGDAWTCAACGEMSEGQFGACWRCGTERPD